VSENKANSFFDEVFFLNLNKKEFMKDLMTWIADNYNPQDVFDYSELAEWAFANGFEIEG
jgi:hypothetical protein